MIFALLIYSDPARDPAPGTPGFEEMMKGFAAFTSRLELDGVIRGGEEFDSPARATSLRKRDGKTVITAGPSAETGEHLGGFYLIDVETAETALDYAALLPSAAWGTIEVRPLASNR